MNANHVDKPTVESVSRSKVTLIKHKSLSISVKLLIKILLILRVKQRKRLITKLGRAMLTLAKKTRERAIKNITNALPELSMKEATDLAFEAYGNCAFGVAESFWLSQIEPDIFCDEETLQILQSGQGACIATMHIGCYEAVPLAVAKFSKKSVTLTNIPTYLEDEMDFYSDVNITAINKNSPNAFSDLLRQAGNSAYISLHCDLYASQTKVTFFGQQTKAPSGVALLAKMTKKPLLLAYAVYRDNGQVNVYFETVQKQKSTLEQGKEQTVEEVMATIYHRFEQIIRQYPSQWYWSYNRWRS
jgi:KDO2-lipid IV(A) lauroyltransferase